MQPAEPPPSSTSQGLRLPAGRASLPSSTGLLGPRIVSGQCIAQRYVVRRFISNGATARVYACDDLETTMAVAVKVVLRELDKEVDSFEVETSAYRCFRSPHLPRLIDAGRLASGAWYMALELVSGERLDTRIGRGPMGIPAVLELGQQLMTALFHAHRAGFLHCDVKPQNVLLETCADRSTLVKLVDFGTCAPIGDNPWGREPTARLRQTVIGTPAYMSPERMRGEPVDVRSDVYTGALVIYEALTGRVPFSGSSAEEIMMAAQRDPVVPPRVIRESCPQELERALLRALCKDPGFRYPSARMLADELAFIAQKCGYPRGPAAWESRGSIPPRSEAHEVGPTRRVSSVSKLAALPADLVGEGDGD